MICTYRGHNRVINCFCGIAQINVSYCILHALGNIRLTSYFCGIARIGAFYYVLHTLGQSQTVLLLWVRPKSCFLYCFTHSGKIRLAHCPCGSVWFHALIVFYMRWGNIRLTKCFCGIAQIHVFYWFSDAMGQYQTNGLLLWDSPKSCFLFCFMRRGPISY